MRHQVNEAQGKEPAPSRLIVWFIDVHEQPESSLGRVISTLGTGQIPGSGMGLALELGGYIGVSAWQNSSNLRFVHFTLFGKICAFYLIHFI